MNFTEVRAKLQDALTKIPEDEPVIRESKRRIFHLFKAVKTPETVVIRDEVKVTRLQQEVTRLRKQIHRLRTEMPAAIQAEMARFRVTTEEIKAEAESKACKRQMENGLKGILVALFMCNADKAQIRACLDNWASNCANALNVSEDEVSPYCSSVLTCHLTFLAAQNDATSFVSNVLEAIKD